MYNHACLAFYCELVWHARINTDDNRNTCASKVLLVKVYVPCLISDMKSTYIALLSTVSPL